MTVGWWVLVAADLGIPLPGTSQDAAARAQEMKFLQTDLSENLLLTTAKAGGGHCLCRSLLEGIAVEKFKVTLCYLRGKP